MGNCQRSVSILPTHVKNYKSVKIYPQLIIKVAESNASKAHLLHKCVCFQMPNKKDFKPEVY